MQLFFSKTDLPNSSYDQSTLYIYITCVPPCSDIMTMVGQAQIDIASQMSMYEIAVMHDIVQELNTMIEVSHVTCLCIM